MPTFSRKPSFTSQSIKVFKKHQIQLPITVIINQESLIITISEHSTTNSTQNTEDLRRIKQKSSIFLLTWWPFWLFVYIFVRYGLPFLKNRSRDAIKSTATNSDQQNSFSRTYADSRNVFRIYSDWRRTERLETENKLPAASDKYFSKKKSTNQRCLFVFVYF